MAKPIIQIKIEGPQGSGKSELAELLAEHCLAFEGYTFKSPATSYDPDDSYQLENDFHIIQIRTKQTRKEASNV
jgi:cytidylate kinase